MVIQKIKKAVGQIKVPGDKSISHRAVMLGSLANGVTEISGFLKGADCLSTIDCFRKMGIDIDINGENVTVHGNGLRGLKKPDEMLYTGNSGTTTRLLCGILAGQNFDTSITGDASIQKRPMGRVVKPLSMMGAKIENEYCPLYITGTKLHGIDYKMPVASAQVKTAIILAGLYADGETSVTEPALSRNHTELMLKSFGADITFTVNPDGTATAHVKPCQELYGQSICVPGDISSAAYFIAAGLLTLDSELLVKNVGINKTRAGFLEVCRNMGADITLVNESLEGGEPRADILVRTSKLHGTTIEGALIPTLIDEIPMIAVMAACAEGTTIIKDAAELKVKETNRIDTTTEALRSMGADITPTDDGMIIQGGHALHGAKINSYLDHRIAMAFAIAALSADGDTIIHDSQCVDVSYPEFFEILDGCR